MYSVLPATSSGGKQACGVELDRACCARREKVPCLSPCRMCEDVGANTSRLVVRWRLIVKIPTNKPTESEVPLMSRKMSLDVTFFQTVPMTAQHVCHI